MAISQIYFCNFFFNKIAVFLIK